MTKKCYPQKKRFSGACNPVQKVLSAKKWRRKCGPISYKFRLMVLIYVVHRADADATCLLYGHPVRAGADAPYHVGTFAFYIGRLFLASNPIRVMVRIFISGLSAGKRIADRAFPFCNSFRIRFPDGSDKCLYPGRRSIRPYMHSMLCPGLSTIPYRRL